MKIMVTGSAGFIGFHVSQALLEDGHEVCGLDNFNSYYSVKLKRDRHALLVRKPGFSGIEGDLCDHEALKAVFHTHHFDLVCHLAAQPGIRYSLTHPFVYQKSNLEAFLSLLEACRQAHTPRLVYASSSSVYGGNRKLPFAETDSVDAPISLYAATKKANELMAHVYSHLYGIQTIGLRLFTVYGPWGRPDMAIWSFTEAMLKGEPIKVFNQGDMRRDFTYIADIVAGIKSALLTPDLQPYEVFNLGNHRSEKLMDLILLLAKTLGVEPRMEMLPIQPGDVPETYAEIELANRLLNFHPATSLTEGIPQFVNWYRDYHGLK
ncbi:MAG: NAD-dependent epimerase/dehydratase family protein [Verrucomicrobia bacterium]|nr:NAD-dependent epimerase/dehydratase family protein [Verrucomicrobiota bacterium]MCG2678499.1 NAD-dependent epimerase/dehydratase family protein [Kiritimatiellia bacterium]MBU4248005.1 NAD-dependent epimerase/dehydratase family protein [Verrucomicrobiota bacterium]MBU4289557.1 NAD-dependent epimerase/dehydratase family protein [Verrucomicrobiota bacterium]MBU4427744.1 NAD-dependent epimerase/dehydratase family protein [Verrucomicrobiota bacterium]